MTDNKKYYWLKLKEDFFRDKAIKKLRRIAGGDTYTIIYLKLMLLSLKDDGKLYFDGVEESFESELALELDEAEENVQVTIQFLKLNGMIEVLSQDEYLLTGAPALTGRETAAAARVRKHRQKQIAQAQALQCNTNVTPCNADVTECNTEVTNGNAAVTDCNTHVTKCNTEIEIEKELDTEIELELNSCAELSPSSTPPPPAETIRLTNFKIPLVHKDPATGEHEEYTVTVEEFTEWSEAFPGVNVGQALKHIRLWCIDNPRKRKTRSGIRSSITTWLSKAQNKGQYPHAGDNARAAPKAQPPRTFAEMEERRRLEGIAKLTYKHDGDAGLIKFCESEKLSIDEVRTWI